MQESRPAIELGRARVHVDDAAGRAAAGLSARAVTVGTDIYFGRGEWAPQTVEGSRLLQHELVHTRQVGRRVEPHEGLAIAERDDPAEREADQRGPGTSGLGSPSLVYRHPTAPSTVARKTQSEIFGTRFLIFTITPALTLAEFQDYVQQQADWYVEPSLTAVDRDDLWRLLLLGSEGPHIRAGIGDVGVDQLRSLTAADLDALRRFCRATHTSQHTVRIFSPGTILLSRRISLGRTLAELESLVPGEVLELTVSQSQLEDVHDGGLMPILRWYWAAFHPNLSRSYDSATPGGRGVEFQKLLDLIAALGGSIATVGTALVPLMSWLRNPHRFSLPMLNQLKANLIDFSGARRLVLVLHTAHDVSSFQGGTSVYEDLVTASGNNVLMIEGAESIASITSRIPSIASTYGQPDAGGVRRISQVIIAGHGSPRTVEIAGMGAPTVSGGAVSYPSESLDTRGSGRAATQALFDALFRNMDPATARLMFDGCLVGAHPVAAGTPASRIPARLAGFENLGALARARATAAGMPAAMPMFTPRASVAQVDTLFDSATGNIQPTYSKDPHAFDAAPNDYVAHGTEPEGVLRAAVEVGATSTTTAETLLRTRLGVASSGWWGEVTIALVTVALSSIRTPGSGIDLRRVNELANVAETVFLTRWPDDFSIDVARLAGDLRPHRFAGEVLAGMLATPTFTAPSDLQAWRGRLITQQVVLGRGGGAAALTAFLTSVETSGMHADGIEPWLSTSTLARHLGRALTITGAGPSVGQIRLALAWYFRDSSNATIRRFLRAHVNTSGATPTFEPAFLAEITGSGRGEREILEGLGLIGTTTVGGRSLPRRNTEFTGDSDNDEAITVDPHAAEVIPRTLDVRPRPSFRQRSFHRLVRGDVVRVMGTVHGWAAIEIAGVTVRQGFVPPGTLRRR